jgi:hypothetical protein
VFDPSYEAQVRLLLRCIPEISRHPCFALKGGTAINLFVRDLPRISVDIDLTYLPLEPRREALQEIHDTLVLIKNDIQQHVRGSQVREGRSGDFVVKLFARLKEKNKNPRRKAPMIVRAMAACHDRAVIINSILKHLGLWLVKPRVPPRANAPPRQSEIDYSDSQVALCEEPFHADPDYAIYEKPTGKACFYLYLL